MSVTKRAIWYIESHLNGELSLASIAEATGVSRFHLSRQRRLSEAANPLAQAAPGILPLALDAGYCSRPLSTARP